MSWLDDVVTDAAVRMDALSASHDAKRYLRGRGVSDEWVSSYRLGWFEEPTARQSSPGFWTWLVRNGWNKIVFPLTDPLGAVVGVQLRAPADGRYTDFLLEPRELHLPTFGLHVALPAAWSSRRLVLVEGVFDYFAVRPYAPDVVAILTSAVSLRVRQLIQRYATTVVSLLDMDGPGRRGSYRFAGLPIPPEWAQPGVVQRVPPVPPYHVIIPTYSEHDPDDLRKTGKVEELRRLTSYGLSAKTAETSTGHSGAYASR